MLISNENEEVVSKNDDLRSAPKKPLENISRKVDMEREVAQ